MRFLEERLKNKSLVNIIGTHIDEVNTTGLSYSVINNYQYQMYHQNYPVIEVRFLQNYENKYDSMFCYYISIEKLLDFTIDSETKNKILFFIKEVVTEFYRKVGAPIIIPYSHNVDVYEKLFENTDFMLKVTKSNINHKKDKSIFIIKKKSLGEFFKDKFNYYKIKLTNKIPL